MKIQFLHNLDEVHIIQLIELYKNEWWSKNRKLTDIKKMLDNTNIIIAVSLPSSNSLIGFARVLTDFVYKAMLFDLIVSYKYRTKGIGEKILDKIIKHPQLKNIEHFELYSTSDMAPFYQKWGFQVILKGDFGIFMRKNGFTPQNS